MDVWKEEIETEKLAKVPDRSGASSNGHLYTQPQRFQEMINIRIGPSPTTSGAEISLQRPFRCALFIALGYMYAIVDVDLSMTKPKRHCNACTFTTITSEYLPVYTNLVDVYRHNCHDLACSFNDYTEAAVEEDIALYTKEIQHLQAITRQLEDERNSLRKISNYRRAFPAPIRRLPPEILTLIFSYCTLINDHNHLTNVSLSIAPVNLSQVCKWWRELTLSAPVLWSNIGIDIDALESISDGESDDDGMEEYEIMYNLRWLQVQHTIQLLHRFLERSKNMPLSLSIRCGAASEFPDRLSAAIDECSSRLAISELDLLLPGDGIYWNFCNNAPRLRHLTLHDPLGGKVLPPRRLPGDAFLKFSALWGLTVTYDLDVFDTVPLPSIQSLHSCRQSLPNLLSLIRSCPNLSYLAVKDSLRSDSQTDLTLCHIRSLSISTLHSENIARFLIVPDLISLTLQHGSPEINLTTDSIIQMFSRSLCTLESLSLNCKPMSTDDVRSIIGHDACLSLRSLSVDKLGSFTNPTKQELVELLHFSDSIRFLPNLHSFRIALSEYTHLDRLYSMLLSRCGTLETVLLSWPKPPRLSHFKSRLKLLLQQLRQLRSVGLDARFSFDNLGRPSGKIWDLDTGWDPYE